ncbi:hypothetical protein C0Q70_11405 [Pomacea canaliculata]|uniref:Uncharacterized protein n=1 Tax=Pomacea canaliculata TaxID=400727 RepID=A0A2T7P5W5_POMCA|nr:hypothetical protein C0Q70_11405 [Pomacea canaliculata]
MSTTCNAVHAANSTESRITPDTGVSATLPAVPSRFFRPYKGSTGAPSGTNGKLWSTTAQRAILEASAGCSLHKGRWRRWGTLETWQRSQCRGFSHSKHPAP